MIILLCEEILLSSAIVVVLVLVLEKSLRFRTIVICYPGMTMQMMMVTICINYSKHNFSLCRCRKGSREAV